MNCLHIQLLCILLYIVGVVACVPYHIYGWVAYINFYELLFCYLEKTTCPLFFEVGPCHIKNAVSTSLCMPFSTAKYLKTVYSAVPHITPLLLLPRLPSWRRLIKCVGFRGQSSWQRSTSSVRKSWRGRTVPESAAHNGPNPKAILSTNHASASITTKLLQEVYTVGHYPFNF